MKIFLAGVPGGGSPGYCKREHELNSFWKYRLWTYYWLTVNKSVMKKPKNIQLFMDSGAFSAYTKNEEVNLEDYITFIKKYRQYIDVYANLDVIAEGDDYKKAAEQTLKNQRQMEEAGLDPLPVFHYGEPYSYLDYYIQKYNYIALGGLVGSSNDKLIHWLNECFSKHICGPDGLPKVKVHAFGVTSLKIMLRYPWYSVDSTSWVVMGRNGKIMVPIYRDGKFVYDENSLKISVSQRSPDLMKKGQHINNVTQKTRDVILKYIDQKGYKLGKSSFHTVDASHVLKKNERWAEKKSNSKKRLLEVIEEPGLSNQYLLRDELNIIYFKDLEAQWIDWPWPFKLKSENLQIL